MHSQQRHFNNEENEARKNGWITSSVQTFGLRILPCRELGSQTDCFLEVKLWPSDLTKTEFIETGWKMEKVEKQGKQNQDEDTSNMIDILLKVKPSRNINFIHRHINVST